MKPIATLRSEADANRHAFIESTFTARKSLRPGRIADEMIGNARVKYPRLEQAQEVLSRHPWLVALAVGAVWYLLTRDSQGVSIRSADRDDDEAGSTLSAKTKKEIFHADDDNADHHRTAEAQD